jgi:hypothetical protein
MQEFVLAGAQVVAATLEPNTSYNLQSAPGPHHFPYENKFKF